MLDPEEKQYSQLRKLAQELHIPIFEAFLELEVRDKDGKVIYQHRQRSHSWCRNAYNIMFCHLAGKDADDSTFEAGKLSLKATGGAVEYGNGPAGLKGFASADASHDGSSSTDTGYRGFAGYDTIGIVVGSGVTAESFEDFALDTKIANGTAAGELAYVESEAHAITWTGGTLTLKNELIRYFNNNSGGSIDVKEVGLITMVQDPGGNAAIAPKFALVARDVLGATVAVPDTGQLKVTYTISLTYPA